MVAESLSTNPECMCMLCCGCRSLSGNALGSRGASEFLVAIAESCPAMVSVNLRSCGITDLKVPVALCHNERLSVVLGDNPLVSPPPEVVARGWCEVRAFSLDVLRHPMKCNRVKLLLVGDGYAGKSSVAAVVKAVVRSRGVARDFRIELPLPDDSGRTVAVERCTVPMKSLFPGRDLVVTMVDVAGQHKSYPTHVFFMSRRSVVALVVDISWPDADKKKSRLEEAIRCV
jgi:hypothetical protein